MHETLKNAARAIIAISVANTACQMIRNNVESETALGALQLKIAALAIGAYTLDRVYVISEVPLERVDGWLRRRVANVKQVAEEEKRKQEAKDAYKTDVWPAEAEIKVEESE